jgi:hypothetical protein
MDKGFGYQSGNIINPAMKYPNSVIPACPELFFEFNLLRCLIPDKQG